MPGVRELATPHQMQGFVGDVVVAGRPVVQISAGEGHIRVHLVMPGIERLVAITASPGSTVHALDEAAARANVPVSQVHASARRVVREAANKAGAWISGSADAPLLVQLGGGAYGLLGAAYERGAAPVANVPSWLMNALRAPDLRGGAQQLFGERATRPVVVAFAQSLVRAQSEPIDFSRIGLALMGSSILEPDHIAEVLVAPGSPWPADKLPTPTLLAETRRVVRLWGATHTRDYLLQGALSGEGRRALIDCLTFAADLGPHAPIRLPGSLTELVDVYRTHVRANPYAPVTRLPRIDTRMRGCADALGPTASRGHETPAPPRDVHVAPGQRLEAPNYGLRYAPRVGTDVSANANSVIPHPAWLRVLDGSSTHGFTFVLPRTCGDLTRWSRVMHNCLGNFDRAAMAGESHLIGVLVRGNLHYVIEVNRHRRIRQFSGQLNRTPDGREHDVIVAHLRDLQVLV